MMKKLLTLSVIAMSAMLSAQANAAAVATNTSTQLTPTNCGALANNVQIQLSSGVVAAYNCDATSFVAAACHTSGTDKVQTVACVYVPDTAVPCADSTCQVPQTGYTGCPAASTVAVAPGDPAFPTAQFDGRVSFGGGSGGGRVGLIPLGDSPCDATGILDAVPATSLDSGTSTSQ